MFMPPPFIFVSFTHHSSKTTESYRAILSSSRKETFRGSTNSNKQLIFCTNQPTAEGNLIPSHCSCVHRPIHVPLLKAESTGLKGMKNLYPRIFSKPGAPLIISIFSFFSGISISVWVRSQLLKHLLLGLFLLLLVWRRLFGCWVFLNPIIWILFKTTFLCRALGKAAGAGAELPQHQQRHLLSSSTPISRTT